MTTINEAGNSYGELLVIRKDFSDKQGVHWFCKCSCGKEKSVSGRNLRRGVVSCGHVSSDNGKIWGKKQVKHNMSRTSFYKRWTTMKARCFNPKNNSYKNYGQRGITVCKSWFKFDNFYKDMFSTFKPNLVLDRTDNDGIYEPKNCRWVDRFIQNNNRRPYSLKEDGK